MVSSQFSDFADSIRDAYSMPTPTSFEDGLELYFVLIQILQQCNLLMDYTVLIIINDAVSNKMKPWQWVSCVTHV